MKLLMRISTQLGLLTLAMVAALPLQAVAQEYPSRPIRILVPFSAGGVGQGALAMGLHSIREALPQ